MPTIDLRADLNAEDDEGRWWSLLRDAVDPRALVPGAVVIAGTDRFWSVVRIEQVDDEPGALRGGTRRRPGRGPTAGPISLTCQPDPMYQPCTKPTVNSGEPQGTAGS